MPKRILIVGGGLAGTIVANGLCRQLRDELASGAVAISMLGASPKHMYQPGLLYVPFGRIRESELFRDQRKVLDRRVPYFIDPAKRIDTDKKTVLTESGKSYAYDFLVIATGSRIRPETIPGMVEGAHWFYDLEGARKMRDALRDFQGGKIVVNVNAPHKCPVAPLEITFMLRDFLAAKGVLEKSEITYTYPVGRLHGLEPVAKWAVPEFERCGIKSEIFFNTKSVDPKQKTLTSEEGVTLNYDLLVRFHRIPASKSSPIRNSAKAVGSRPSATRCCARDRATYSSSVTPPIYRSRKPARPRISRPTRKTLPPEPSTATLRANLLECSRKLPWMRSRVWFRRQLRNRNATPSCT